jgi:hypothetical protein
MPRSPRFWLVYAAAWLPYAALYLFIFLAEGRVTMAGAVADVLGNAMQTSR